MPVINEFYQVCLAQQYIAEGGIGYAKELLEKSLGVDKAADVITRLTASLQVRPFEFIRKTEPSQVLNFIQDEHPQTIAMILSYLSAQQSAMILSALSSEKQADVAKRIAMMDRTSPEVIKGRDNVYQVCFTDPAQGAASAQYISDNALATNVAVIYNNADAYSTGIYQTFEAKAADLGLLCIKNYSHAIAIFTTQVNTNSIINLYFAKG